jgi:hypothetical protein
METRTIIGEFPRSAFSQAGVYFPVVRAWIKDGYAVQANFQQEFLNWGAVFLGPGVCGGFYPYENQYGLFSCDLTYGGPAVWSVGRVENSLCEVIKTPAHVGTFLGFYDWLKFALTAPKTEIFSGSGAVYFELVFCGLVVGPFVRSGSGYAPCPSGINSWSVGQGIPVWGMNNDGPFFTDTKRHPRGLPFPVDTAAMVRKVCGLLGEGIAPGRGKLKALSEAVVNVQNTQFIPGAIQEVAKLLEDVGVSLVHDQTLVSSLLSNELISNALEARWLQTHEKAKGETSAVRIELSTLVAKKAAVDEGIRNADVELKRRQTEVSHIVELEVSTRLQARDAFDKELKILAADPAKVAVLSGVFSQFSAGPQSILKSSAFVRKDLSAGKWGNLGNELERIGLAGSSRAELAVVCHAAFLSGQPVWIRSIFADVLAKVLLSCRGHASILTVDVPAGLLEPLVFPSDDSGAKALLFLYANRSDLSLTLSGINEVLLRQVIQPGAQSWDIVLTLESNELLSVKQAIPLGPILDDAFLSFGLPREPVDMHPDVGHIQGELSATEASELVQELGPAVMALEPLKLSSFRMTCQLAFSALRAASKDGSGDAKRLLFKYWILPRIDIADAIGAFQENATDWESDPILKVLGGKANRDGIE